MYNVETVTEALMGLVGFRQPNQLGVDAIDADLTLSRSGLYVDSAHELLTPQNLQNAALALYEAGQWQEWDEAVLPYAKGTLVSKSGDLYRALKATSAELDADEDWKVTTPLSAFLRRVMHDSVGDILAAVRTRKLNRVEGRSRLAKTALYDAEGSINDAINPIGRFVTLRIAPRDGDTSLTLASIGVSFSQAVTNLPIYIYGDGQEPIAVRQITTPYGGRFAWPTFAPVSLIGSSAYYVGYYEADLPAGTQALRRNRTIGVSCGTCSSVNAALWQRWNPYVQVDAVRVDPVELDSERKRFDFGAEDVVTEQNYGLNLTLTVDCDVTQLLVSQAGGFAEALRQQAVVKLLNSLAYTTVTTSTEQMVKDKAMYALQNGEAAKLETMLDALDVELSGLSPECLPVTDSGAALKLRAFRRR